MELHQSRQLGEPRLRVVFASKSIALGLPLGATLGDVADWIGDVARLHNGPLLSIDVRLAPGRRADAPFGSDFAPAPFGPH